MAPARDCFGESCLPSGAFEAVLARLGRISAISAAFHAGFSNLRVRFASSIRPLFVRETKESQYKLWQVQIADVKFNSRHRDDIPAVLIGLLALYLDEPVRKRILAILERHVRPRGERNKGRPGMDFWRNLVLGVLKMGLNCDFARLLSLACNYKALRQMRGHAEYGDDAEYTLQTIVDNVGHLTVEALGEINGAVVESGHSRLGHASGAPLKCRVDSAATRTNVHRPTDVNPLWDAMACLLRTLGRTCAAHGVKGWRKHAMWTERVEKAFQAVNTANKWRDKEKVKAYLALCGQLVGKARATIAELQACEASTDKIDDDLAHAVRRIDQIERRLIKGEKIPHAELGLPVCFMEDRHNFILHHEVLHEGGDSDMIVPFMQEAKRQLTSIESCSMDRGYWSPSNREQLDNLLALNALPRKGGKSKADQERESAPDFAEARRLHPAIASAINALNQRGLDLIRTHGAEGFVGVLAADIHRLGRIVRSERRKYEKWHKKRERRKAA